MALIIYFSTVTSIANGKPKTDLPLVVSSSPIPSINLINSRNQEIASSSSLSDSEKKSLSALYRQAISNLELATTQRKKADTFNQIILNGTSQTERLKRELRLIEEQSSASLFFDKKTPLSEVEQELHRLKADVAVAETLLAELKNQYASAKLRPVSIKQRLSEVKRQLSELSSPQNHTTSVDNTVEFSEAKSWVRDTFKEQLRSERLMLEQELSSLPI
ncbi:hypothetical protein [Zooshikella ganghwensis]|nr:hypothetical protein [Zooshikella ganghwensis]